MEPTILLTTPLQEGGASGQPSQQEQSLSEASWAIQPIKDITQQQPN